MCRRCTLAIFILLCVGLSPVLYYIIPIIFFWITAIVVSHAVYGYKSITLLVDTLWNDIKKKVKKKKMNFR